MKIIGITGGVGAGKTKILSYIGAHYRCRIIRADEAAHLLYEPGQECYHRLVELLGQEILNADGTIHKGKMAELIFGNKRLLDGVNKVIHPAPEPSPTAGVRRPTTTPPIPRPGTSSGAG